MKKELSPQRAERNGWEKRSSNAARLSEMLLELCQHRSGGQGPRARGIKKENKTEKFFTFQGLLKQNCRCTKKGEKENKAKKMRRVVHAIKVGLVPHGRLETGREPSKRDRKKG